MGKQIGFIYGLIKSNRSSTKALETQYGTCSKYADSHEIEVLKFCFDHLGDGSGKRTDMERMLEDAAKVRATVILVADLSCIDPDIQKAGQHLEEMRKLGLQVISVTGVGGNVFYSENKMLPEGIFHYLKSSADNSDSGKEAKRPKRGRPVQRSSN